MILKINSTDKINWNPTPIGQILNNVINILNIVKGEIPYMRQMGISSDFIDKPINENKGALITDVIQNIHIYEPRAKVKEVNINVATNDDVNIEVVIEIEH